MILGQMTPQSSLPAAKSSWKATKIEDVVNLIKIIQGTDPAWRFLEMRQIDEIRRNLAQALPSSAWAAAVKHEAAANRSIKEAIELAKGKGSPFLAREMCVAQTAQERLARWEAGRTTSFNDAPLGLRLLLNARTRPTNRRLIDNDGISGSPDLKHVIRIAEQTGWIKQGSSHERRPSDEAKERVQGAFRSSVVRPVGGECLALILQVRPQDMAAIGRELVNLAEADLHFFFKPLRQGAELIAANSNTGVSTKLPIVEHGLEMIELQANRRASREQLVKAVAAALPVLGDSSLKGAGAVKDFTTSVANVCLPQTPGGSKTSAGEYYMSAWASELRALKGGFSGLLPAMNFYIDSRNFESKVKEHKGFVLQREVVSLAGHWLSQKDLPLDVKEDVKQLLIKGANPYGSRFTIEAALHWITKNPDDFSTEQLKKLTLAILENLDRSFLHHSLYISGESARRDGRGETMAAFETVIELVKAGRLGVDDASEAYRYAGHYKVFRDQETGSGLWTIQRAETEKLMLTLDQLCGGEPKKAWEGEHSQMAEEWRLTRNEKVRVSKARSDRMAMLAGNIKARMGQR